MSRGRDVLPEFETDPVGVECGGEVPVLPELESDPVGEECCVL